jgi:hypothetical protein
VDSSTKYGGNIAIFDNEKPRREISLGTIFVGNRIEMSEPNEKSQPDTQVLSFEFRGFEVSRKVQCVGYDTVRYPSAIST